MIVMAVAVVQLGQSPGDQALQRVAIFVGLALGGHLSVGDFGVAEVVIRPLGLTVVGLFLLGVIFARRLRRSGAPSRAAVGLQVVRVALVYLIVTVILAAVGNVGGVVGERLDVGSTVLFGLLSLAITLAVAVLAVPQLFSGTAAQVRAAVLGILKGVWLILWLSTVATIGWFAVEYARVGFEPLRNHTVVRDLIITAITFLPNLALYLLFIALGIPVDTSIGGATFGGPSGDSGTQSLLWAMADSRPLYWLMPAIAAVIVLLGALRAARYARKHGVRRGGLIFGLAFPVVLLLVGSVLSINGVTAAQTLGVLGGGLGFNLLYTLLFGLAWGLALGILAGWMSPSPPRPAAPAPPPSYPPPGAPGYPPPGYPAPSVTTPVNLAAVQVMLFLAGVAVTALLILVTKP
jgi:hypothetical protein